MRGGGRRHGPAGPAPPARRARGARQGRVYHTRLSDIGERPACAKCGGRSDYYCNMNDQYLCLGHVPGHDLNEY